MKIDLFENKYRPSNGIKIVFIDIVCFLLVATLTIGFCYAYLSGKAEIEGSATMAKVAVDYQYDTGSGYVSVDEVYVKLNGSNTAQSLTDTMLTPGDKITIVGRVVSLSNVSVYMLAKLEIKTKQKGEDITEVVWFNIGSNDPLLDEEGKEIEDPDHTSAALTEVDYKQLTTTNKVGDYGAYDIYQVGASSLGEHKTKDLAIPYTFSGDKYVNGDEITSVKFTLHVHQKDHLRLASDFYLYSEFENANKEINGYSTESIYAAHYITDNQLDAK